MDGGNVKRRQRLLVAYSRVEQNVGGVDAEITGGISGKKTRDEARFYLPAETMTSRLAWA